MIWDLGSRLRECRKRSNKNIEMETCQNFMEMFQMIYLWRFFYSSIDIPLSKYIGFFLLIMGLQNRFLLVSTWAKSTSRSRKFSAAFQAKLTTWETQPWYFSHALSSQITTATWETIILEVPLITNLLRWNLWCPVLIFHYSIGLSDVISMNYESYFFFGF